MPKAEWRLFLSDEGGTRHVADARTLIDLLQDIEPVVRKDIYVKADSDVGVKRRGGGSLEFKALKRRQALGGGVGPGTAETFEKVRLGDAATLADIVEHLRVERGVTEELETLLRDPLEVEVVKAVRKDVLKAGEGTASFEFSEVTVNFAEMPEDYAKKWITFCAEGSMDDIEAFMGSTGRPLVPLMSLRGAFQVGYPQFVSMISS